MRYFFLAYALVALLVVGIFGVRGQKFSKPPIRIFPDMDNQDKIRAQKPDAFFADGHGARLPVSQTQPRGFNEDGAHSIGGIPEYEFGGQTGYLYTGHVGDYFGSGMPEELKLTEEQKPKVKAALEESDKKRQEIFADSSAPREQRREKMQAIMDEQNKKFKEILTPDHYGKWEKMRESARGGRGPEGAPGKKKEREKAE